MNKIKKTTTINIVIEIIALCTVILLIANYQNIINQLKLGNNDVISRLLLENIDDESRVHAIEHNLKMFSKSPIFGVGTVEASNKVQYVADTSTSTYLLSIFGIFGGLYTLYWIIGILKIKNINIIARLFLLIIVLIILNKEPHQNILLTWCFMFFGLKNALKKEGKYSDKKDDIYFKE